MQYILYIIYYTHTESLSFSLIYNLDVLKFLFSIKLKSESMLRNAAAAAMLLLSATAATAAVVPADACTDYNKVVNGVCAQACLNKTVGICPIAIVVKAGGLATGTCAAAGFTKPNGTQSQKAGPCGTIVFDDYVKPGEGKTRTAEMMLADAPTGKKSLATFDGAQGTTFNWHTVDDPVMGGQSHSAFELDGKNNAGHWTGEVKIVPFLKAPGFCTLQTQGSNSFQDVSGTKAFHLRARNQATAKGALTRFALQLETKGGKSGFKTGTYTGNITIPATGKWVDVSADWDSFDLTWRGERISGPKLTTQLDQITQVGLGSSFSPAQAGPFDPEIQDMYAL